MPLLMGIDLGTSSVKVIIINETGKQRAFASRGFGISSPKSGDAEQDPYEWRDRTFECIRECMNALGTDAEGIAGISLSGQMHGLVMLDINKKVIRPAILHCDARSGAQCNEIREVIGNEINRDCIMNPIYTGFLLPSLLWVRENEPANYERLCHVMLPKDYIRFALTGEIATDYSDASATLAFDVGNMRWASEVLSRLDIPEAIFPQCSETAQVCGQVSAEAAGLTGLRAGTLVTAGGGDQVMQSIGNGVTQTGWGTVNIGTAGQVSFPCNAPVVNPALNTNTFCSYQRDKWFTMGAIMNAGLCLGWLSSLFEGWKYEDVVSATMDIAPGSGGLIFLPYLNGERTPHVNPLLSGMFAGIRLGTDKARMANAVMEGVAFALCDCAAVCRELGIRWHSIVASGGGARNAEWLRILADVLNTPLYTSQIEEQAAVGAAIAAGAGSGVFGDIEEGCRSVVTFDKELVTPDAVRHEQYMEYYALFRKAYLANKELLENLTVKARSQQLHLRLWFYL